ncbi:hypothetical protein DUNSADRAFT_15991 [Dunaliella salina]|uniref:Encoded protein n=1 Tax=Dunaliella salina TaxID=3046 RepID=A0ABQ7G4F5_DUNSA|nr:hypothetical protein DUNSADRAFT_15991 [Dunaliella salina]|eukprot:KAF5829497.1 hypothetical protein DUNSADRAFT_15991 [Dunaliella salina]
MVLDCNLAVFVLLVPFSLHTKCPYPNSQSHTMIPGAFPPSEGVQRNQHPRLQCKHTLAKCSCKCTFFKMHILP